MNITFLIGNGFDLRLGMQTRYIDMYDDYISSPSDNSIVQEFKKTLKKDAPKGYETWGDFEMAMARHAKTFQNEDDFVMCVRDFKKYLVSYLKNEQTKFLDLCKDRRFTCASELKESLESFYKGQTPNVINEIESHMRGQGIVYNFITFNYTASLDAIIAQYNELFSGSNLAAPIHIHGSLGAEVVLGIDNVEQFESLMFTPSKKTKRAFVKPEFNNAFDKARIDNATKLIEESNVICVYGLSLGESDATWKNKLYEWLIADVHHHLVYYTYNETPFYKWNSDEIMDEEDSRKEVFFKKLCLNDAEISKIFDQVHIPVDYDIFNFKEEISDSIGNDLQRKASRAHLVSVR